MPRLARVKLGGNYAKATGSGKEANFYFPGLTPFFTFFHYYFIPSMRFASFLQGDFGPNQILCMATMKSLPVIKAFTSPFVTSSIP
jgi:hypothetical protein